MNETSVLQAIENGSALIFGHWYPLERLKHEGQRILVWMNDEVYMAIAHNDKYPDPIFWFGVKAWMPYPEPPEL
jgi:hypothetical protein